MTPRHHETGAVTLHDAAKVVGDFMVWQHNFAEWEKPHSATDDQKKRAERIERAFLIGAASMAAAAFSLQQADERLFLTNVLGTYKGLGPDEAEDELREMFEQISEASDEEENATRVGGDLILDYVAKAKIDEKKVYLAGLQKKCWDGETPNRHKDRSDSEV